MNPQLDSVQLTYGAFAVVGALLCLTASVVWWGKFPKNDLWWTSWLSLAAFTHITTYLLNGLFTEIAGTATFVLFLIAFTCSFSLMWPISEKWKTRVIPFVIASMCTMPISLKSELVKQWLQKP
jgi:glycerol uptake facilitator-like aquaporin